MGDSGEHSLDAKVNRVSEDLTVQVPALRFSKGLAVERVVALAKEIPYTLFVNDRGILSIATLSTHLAELLIGFLVF